MKIELEDVSPVKKSLMIEADPDEIERETEAVLRRYAREVKVPGFRPGKVPISLIRTRFAKEIQGDVRERLVTHLYTEATTQKGLQPLGDPILEEVTEGADQPFRFKTTFEVAPSFTPRGYKGVEAREPRAEVADAEVEQMLEDLRKSQVRLVAEEGRVAVTGDVIVADVAGSVEGEPPFRREGMMIEVGATENLPAFNEPILGAKAGSILEFHVDYPKEYDAKHLAGRTVHYHLEVREVKRAEVPNLDDELAKDLGDFDSLPALRERIRADLLERKRVEARGAVRQAVLEKVLLENPVPLPEVLVEREVRHRLEDLVRAMMSQGIDPRDAKLDWSQIRERQLEPARKSVHARLVLDSVAACESIAVEPPEVEERIRKEAHRMGRGYKEVRDGLAKEGGLEALRNQMVREKSLDFLTAVANIHPEG